MLGLSLDMLDSTESEPAGHRNTTADMQISRGTVLLILVGEMALRRLVPEGVPRPAVQWPGRRPLAIAVAVVAPGDFAADAWQRAKRPM